MSLVYEPPSLWFFVIAALRQIYSDSCTHTSQEKGAHHAMGEWGACGGSTRVGQGAEGGRKHGQEPLLWFLGEGTGEKGQQARIG